MDDEEAQFEPEELMDKPFYYNVVIEEATIPDNFQNIYVEYSVKIDEKKSETFQTNIVNCRFITGGRKNSKPHLQL